MLVMLYIRYDGTRATFHHGIHVFQHSGVWDDLGIPQYVHFLYPNAVPNTSLVSKSDINNKINMLLSLSLISLSFTSFFNFLLPLIGLVITLHWTRIPISTVVATGHRIISLRKRMIGSLNRIFICDWSY